MLREALHGLQDRLLHLPMRLDLAEALVLAQGKRLTPWPSVDTTQPRGWLRKAEAARGTVVMFHGNDGHALQREWFADAMETLGFSTLLAEYPGYGHRPGKTDEHTLVTDAAATLAAFRQEQGAAPLLAGKSLGAGVAAAALARDPRNATGILLMTPWDTFAHVVRHHYPLLPLPLHLMLRDCYDSITHLKSFAGPKLVLIAENDDIVPAALGHALFAALDKNKKLLVVADSGHNDWMAGMTTERWRQAMTFLSER